MIRVHPAMAPPCAAMVLTFALSTADPAAAALFRVGFGTGCTHSTVALAFAAAAANAESDILYLTTGTHDVAATIEVTADEIYVYGGYPSCETNVATSTSTIRGTTSGADTFRVHGAGSPSLDFEDVTLTRQIEKPGRGLRIEAGATVHLARTYVRDGSAADGGNIHISGSGALLELRDGTFIIDGTATSGDGGGIYCDNGASVEGGGFFKIARNEAFDSGGGVYLDDCTLDVWPALNPGSAIPAIEAAGFDENSALHGDGGGIAAVNGATVEIKNNDWQRVAQVYFNQAPEGAGGGIFLDGSGTTGLLRSIQVVENSALGPGGGIAVSNNATFAMHLGAWGECPFPFGASCSSIAGNRSTGTGAAGLGAFSGAYAEAFHTLILDNVNELDFGGSAAGAIGASLLLEGCEIFQNDPNGGSGTLTSRLFAGTGSTVTVAFSTIVEDAGAEGVIEVANATQVRLLSSIVQGAQVFLPAQPPATTVDCVVVPESASLPNGSTGVTLHTDPTTLFALSTPEDFSLLRNSVAQDYCDTLLYDPLTLADIGGQARGWDDPTEGNVYGAYDLGADEWHPGLFGDGFEGCGTCRWSNSAP